MVNRPFCGLVATVVMSGLARADLPPGFTETVLLDGLNQAVGVTFAPDGLGFVWEKAGIVRPYRNGRLEAPVIDISDEVGNWRDFGLVGFCLDPDFLHNGHVYLWYAVDYHHLRHAGTPQYDPTANEYYHDSIGRLTRYTLRPDSGFRLLDPQSRRVILGRGMGDGPAITHLGHGTGTVVFGEDGTLIASIGDGASWDGYDTGGPMPNSSYTAYEDGILRPEEDVGVFRAQMVNSLSGKILRINPETGEGVPGNPFFDADHPSAPRSRVWALGLRNPWRVTIRPGSSAGQPAGAAPGVLYFGDVQEGVFDEFDVCTRAGQNFGWPLYEGLTWKASYGGTPVENPDAPNPAGPGCGRGHYLFQELLVQETLRTPSWPDPCGGEIAAGTPTFMHTRPVLDWYDDGWTRCGGFVDGLAVTYNVGSPNCPVRGPVLGGGCPVGGVWYESGPFPAEWRHSYFHGDFVGRWIHNTVMDDQDRPVEIRHFQPDAGRVVCLALNPADGALYYISYSYQGSSQLRRIAASTGAPPHAAVSQSGVYGSSPLRVEFRGDQSTDPEGQPLVYEWAFGDGATSAEANPSHTFTATGPARFDVRLRVTDASGRTGEATTFVTVNNTPPRAAILSPRSGGTYPGDGPSDITLEASLSDDEQAAEELTCRWDIIPHHNDHTHPDPPVATCSGTARITPEPCDPADVFWYEFVLNVTDPLGLTTTVSARLNPDCCRADFNGDGFLDFFDHDAFVECFELGVCPPDRTADFNRDEFTDFFDYDEFVAAFERGC
jgi:glucose/arabinose dehydrogenase